MLILILGSGAPLVSASAGGVTSPGALTAPDPLTCAGYAEPRLFLDSQGWWIQTPGQNGTDHGHVHTSTCFPLFQTVKGTVPLDIRITMHNNPGALTSLAIQIFTDKGATVVARKTFKPALTCASECEFWVHLDADTSLVPYDGRQEWRIRPTIKEPDGKTMIGSTSWQTYLANGKPKNDYRGTDMIQGKGWYTDTDYTKARLDSGVPMAPVTKPWTIEYRCESDTGTVSDCLVTVDPHFHSGNMGKILFQTNSSSESKRTLTIDPTQFSPGQHKLVIRTLAAQSGGSTSAGILVIPFTVQ